MDDLGRSDNRRKRLGCFRWSAMVFAVLITSVSCTHVPWRSEPTPEIRLYALDCGRIHFTDASAFSRTGEYDGRDHTMAVVCAVVQHPDGVLVWDAGLNDGLTNLPDGQSIPDHPKFGGTVTVSVPITMQEQLQSIGLAPENVDYFAPSHSHMDHVGNIALFEGATLLVNEKELEFALADGIKTLLVDPAHSAVIQRMNKKTFSDGIDVFGDGTTRIIPMPGHSPGHSVLQVKLENNGYLLFTGDLYHFNESREKGFVPKYNDNLEETLNSMKDFEELAKRLGARVIIQHSMADAEDLPKPPAYLD